MSPSIRSMLEDAADDGVRPVQFDLAAVRTAAHRTMWRRHVTIGGVGLGAAAVITSVALLLGPSVPGAGVQPAGDGAAGPAPTAEPTRDGQLDDPIDDAISPLVAALEANGYDVAESYSATVSEAASEPSDGSVTQTLTAKVLPVTRGDLMGAAVGAAFNDIAAVTDIFLGDVEPRPLQSEVNGYDYGPQCAVFPAFVHRSDFAWDSCEEAAEPPSGASVLRIATGGDSHGDALGVTIVRPDGSGVSLAVSSAAYDRPLGGGQPTATPLDELPLSADELLLAAERMLEAGPLVTPPEEGVVAGPTAGETAAPAPEPLPSAEPDTWLPSSGGADTCPDGSTIVEVEDGFGTTRLVQVAGTTWVCASAAGAANSAEHYVGPWRNQAGAPVTGEWIGPFALDTCRSRPCGPAVWSAVGVAPVGVTQVSVVLPDGTTTSANIADRTWVVRVERSTIDELPGELSGAVRGEILVITVVFDPVSWPTVEWPDD